MSHIFQVNDTVAHWSFPNEVGIVTAVYANGFLDADFGSGSVGCDSPKAFTLVCAATPIAPGLSWPYGEEDWPAPKPKVCDCGAVKAKTTHTHWCSAHESGGTPPYKRPERRMF
jgi:hypothetical protein